MDLLTLLLIVVAIVAILGWGFGTYSVPPAPVTGAVAQPVGWTAPVGIIGVLAIIAIIMMLVTNWRPLGPVW